MFSIKFKNKRFLVFFFKNNENKHFQFQIMKNKRFADFLIKFKNERFACFFFKNNEKLDFQAFQFQTMKNKHSDNFPY